MRLFIATSGMVSIFMCSFQSHYAVASTLVQCLCDAIRGVIQNQYE